MLPVFTMLSISGVLMASMSRVLKPVEKLLETLLLAAK